MKNKLSDLNNHLFAQLERLSDEDLTGEQLETEIARTKAVTSVSREIVAGAQLSLKAQMAYNENMIGKAPVVLEITDGEA